MMSDYGPIFKAQDVKKQLMEYNKAYNNRQTFGEYYGVVDIAKQQAENSLRRDYESAILDAYKANYEQEKLVNSIDFADADKARKLQSLEDDLMLAYDTYKNTYATNMQSVQEGYDESIAKIDKELTNYAENVKLLADTPYDYLQYLWDNKDELGDDVSKLFTDDVAWSKFVKDGELLTKEQLRAMHFDANTDFINEAGIDFYDQMINALAGESGSKYSYGKWMSETNPELFEWSQSDNLYDFTTDGTNMGTFKSLLGMSSIDNEYRFIERAGGLTNTEISSMFDKFYTAIETIDSELYKQDTGKDKRKGDRMDAVQEMLSSFEGVELVARQLGIYDEIDKEYGWEKMKADLEKYYDPSLGTRNIKKASRVELFNKMRDSLKNSKPLSMLTQGYHVDDVYTSKDKNTLTDLGVNTDVLYAKKNYKNEKYAEQSKNYEAAKKQYVDTIAMLVKYAQSLNVE